MAGEDGTSPRRWMMTTTSAMANGRSRGGTDHSTSALEGACRAERADSVCLGEAGAARGVPRPSAHEMCELRCCRGH